MKKKVFEVSGATELKDIHSAIVSGLKDIKLEDDFTETIRIEVSRPYEPRRSYTFMGAKLFEVSGSYGESAVAAASLEGCQIFC